MYIEVTDGEKAGKYQSKLVDFNDQELLVDLPIHISSKNVQVFHPGISFKITYNAPDGSPCSFYSMVIRFETGTVPLLVLSKPKKTEIQRLQRREFLRVPVHVTLSVASIDKSTRETARLQGMTVNVSGGGLAFVIHATAPIQVNDWVGVEFEIPRDTGSDQVSAKLLVLRLSLTDGQKNSKICSGKFLEIREEDRQKIIRYTFMKQIEMRKKEVL